MTGGGPQYDAVIVGGGHNGLTAACYLAGAGLSVAVLERGSVIGGAAVTEELIPGFCVSTGSYVLSLMPRRILDELDLWSAGLQYLARDPRIFVPFPDGTSLTWWGDPDRLHAELAKISPRDAKRFAGLRGVHRAGRVRDGPVHPPQPAVVGGGRRRVPQPGRPHDLPEVLPRVRRRHRRVLLRERADAGRGRGHRHHRHVPRPARRRHRLRQALSLHGHGDRASRGAGRTSEARMGAITQALARVATARGRRRSGRARMCARS